MSYEATDANRAVKHTTDEQSAEYVGFNLMAQVINPVVELALISGDGIRTLMKLRISFLGIY
ncbi:hypothetical protein [Rhizobium sp. WL3]|uniref:hypothetical protein n=1 Tax=Rhizobium sp. WL3 TaxID=2603277 RepID=UPI001FEFF5B1|nr:hypothetical protein [Rhizobium sp. WL3]